MTNEEMKFLHEVRIKSQNPEMLNLILIYATNGMADKIRELNHQVSDMEVVATMALNDREYKKQTPFIIEKLEKWQSSSFVLWDETIKRLKGKIKISD